MDFETNVQACACSCGKVNLAKAKKIIAAAESKATEIGVPMVISVVDEGANLIAEHRMDGALIASISISRDKAYTAVALKISTEDLANLTQPGQSLFGIHTTDGGHIVIFGGGVPILEHGKVIGGIGVSGGTVSQDIEVVNAALNALDNCWH